MPTQAGHKNGPATVRHGWKIRKPSLPLTDEPFSTGQFRKKTCVGLRYEPTGYHTRLQWIVNPMVPQGPVKLNRS